MVILVALQGLLEVTLLLIGDGEQAEDLELAPDVPNPVGQGEAFSNCRMAMPASCCLRCSSPSNSRGVDERLLVIPSSWDWRAAFR